MRLVKKHAEVRYQTPAQRPGCRNCRHCDDFRPDNGAVYVAPTYRCLKHFIEITSGGFCPDHSPYRRHDESGLAFQRRQLDLLASLGAEIDAGKSPQVSEPA